MSEQKRKTKKIFRDQTEKQIHPSLTFKPFLQIEAHETIVIERHRTESISYHPTLQITSRRLKKLTNKHTETSSSKSEMAQQADNNNKEENISPTRLDCSGQGECQPVTEEDDAFHPDSMREFLKNAE